MPESLNSQQILEILRAHISSLKNLSGADLFLRKSRGFQVKASADQGIQLNNFEGSETQVRLSKDSQVVSLWLIPSDIDSMKAQIQGLYKTLERIPGQSVSMSILSAKGSDSIPNGLENKGFADTTLDDVSLEEKIQRTWNLRESILQGLKKHSPEKSAACYFEKQTEVLFWATGANRVLVRKQSQVLVEARARIQKDSEDQEFISTGHEGHYLDLDWSRVSKEAVSGAEECLGQRFLPTMESSILFDPNVVSLILREFFKEICFLEESSFKSLVFPEGVTVFDDPHANKKVGSAHWDDEGIATERLDLLVGGRFHATPKNLRLAAIQSSRSTGHARRKWGGFSPTLGYHNLCMDPGPRDRIDLERDFKKGLRVFDGYRTRLNGGRDFFVFRGSWWDQGHRQYGVRPMLCVLKPTEIFQRVRYVGRDLVWRGRLAAPSLLCDNIPLVGITDDSSLQKSLSS